ncbi:unnamed protein product [uncultured bacterium]|nr:unnamed protein product [uncultured bacterium]
MSLVLRPPGHRTGLPDHLANIGTARKRTALLSGVCTLVAVVVGLVLLTCVLDAVFHLPRLARGFALVGTLAAAGVVWLRGPAAALRLPTEPLPVALELEERFPTLNDSLASAVSFLSESDEAPVAGSRLRAAAVRTAEKLAERQDLARVIPYARLWRAAWVCSVVVAAAVPLGLWNTGRTAVALARFADPFGAHPWPPKTRIDILAPQPLPFRMPRGEPLEIRFAVRGEIPGHAEVAVRLDGGSESEQSIPLVEADPRAPAPQPASGQPVPQPTTGGRDRVAFATVRIPADEIPRNFAFRVRANDGDTGWQTVNVVSPPHLVPLDGRPSPHLYVTPPAYTGLRPLDLPDGAAVIEVPAGSRVRLRAAANVRLSAAALAYIGDRSGADPADPRAPEAPVPDVPVAIGPDGQAMEATFVPPQTGTYLLKMTDETGMTGTRPLDVRLIPDPAPAVTLVRPAPGRDPPVLVPTARLTVQMTVEDRVYAFRRVFIEYRVGKDGPVRVIPLADAEAAGAMMPAIAGPVGVVRPQPTRYEGLFEFPVAAFLRDDGTPLREGDVLTLWAAADDWDDVTVPKEPGRGEPVQILIVSKEGAEAYILSQLGPLRKDIAAARAMQRDARAKAADGDLLGAEQAQRKVRDRVTDPRDGLKARADLLRETARANGLSGTRTADRTEVVADGLNELAEGDLAAAEPALADARQRAARPPSGETAGRTFEDIGLSPNYHRPLLAAHATAVKNALAKAKDYQQGVDDRLSALLDVLASWGSAGEIRGEAQTLRDLILAEARVADALPMKVPPGLPPSVLTLEQRGELDRAAGRLDNLADRANQLIVRTGRLAEESDRAAIDARSQAAAKELEAATLRAQAGTKPLGSVARRELIARADELSAEAAALRAFADKAAAEAAALRQALADADVDPAEVEKALAAAGAGPAIARLPPRSGGGQVLVNELRDARRELENNRPGIAAAQERSAAARLDRMAAALAEKDTESVPQLAQKWKTAADQLDALAKDQFDLDRKIDEANRIADPAARADALRALAAEQQQLLDRGKELALRLTRERADAAAKDAREAVDKMQAMRDTLEQGKAPPKAPGKNTSEAFEKLADARDKLDQAGANAPKQQVDERRKKAIDRLTALRDKQRQVAADAARLQKEAAGSKGWDRAAQQDYLKLQDREKELAAEVRALAAEEFKDYPVFARFLDDAAGGMDVAGVRVNERVKGIIDADPDLAYDPALEKAKDARDRRPMELAARRLDWVLEAISKAPEAGPAPEADPAAGKPGIVPPLAQVAALRALQAELNERTAAFDKAHPDRSKLDEFAREELKEIEDVQREMAELFSLKEVLQLFEKKEPPAEPKVKP